MIILHISQYTNTTSSGVGVVVPQHVSAQHHYAETALLNLADVDTGSELQLPYQASFDLDDLKAPFSSPDLVVFHEVYKFQYLSIAKTLRARKIPYIIIPHGSLQTQALHKKRIKKLAANFLLWNRFINHACGIQCLSECEKEQTGFKSPKFIGTNGVFTPTLQKKKFHQEYTRIIFIGRLEIKTKGLDILTSAISQCADLLRSQNCRLDIYGPDKFGYHQELQSLISKEQVNDLIVVHNAVFGKEKAQILQDADLFIQASRLEGMPMGILEALSYGLPCIVTEGTCLGEHISRYHAGWVSQTDPFHLAQAISQSVKERDTWRSKSNHAVQLIYENYSWDTVAKNTVEIYQEFIEKAVKA